MIPFYSKRNQVYASLHAGRPVVEKHFTSMDDWQREFAHYTALSGQLPLPKLLHSQPGLLVTEYCPQPTFLNVLEEQERAGFSPGSWLALAAWLRRCHDLCGELPEDGNLRNFLWDSATGTVIGLDLEGYHPCSMAVCGAKVIAALLTYDPADTPVKRQAAETLASALLVPTDIIAEEKLRLQRRRDERKPKPISGVILAGGMSRRMGQSKADLKLLGKSLLRWQVEKLQALGIRDVMLSGSKCPHLPGTRIVADEFPQRGPLGGIHACLKAARCPRCLVVSVDTPLVPIGALARLCRSHMDGVTVLRHGGKQEPLLAVYDSGTAQVIQTLIESGSAAVRALEHLVPWNHFDYMGPEPLLLNCNTPEEFSKLKALAAAYRAHGLPL